MRKNERLELNDCLSDMGIVCSEDVKEFESNRANYIKIEESFFEGLDGLMQFIPDVMLSKQCKGAYKVIFDRGLGELQKAKDYPGFFRGNIVAHGTNNKITGGALLKEISVAPQIAANIFNVLSVITGQYYISRINNSLQKLNDRVDNILRIWKNQHYSEMEANSEMLANIINGFKHIIRNNDLKNATLLRVQEIKINALTHAKFYKRETTALIGRLKSNDAEKVINENLSMLTENISCYWLSLYQYCLSTQIELLLSQHFDDDYIAFLKNEIECYDNEYIDNVNKWASEIDRYILTAKALNSSKLTKGISELPEAPIMNISYGGGSKLVNAFNGIISIYELTRMSVKKSKDDKDTVRLQITEDVANRVKKLKELDSFGEPVKNLEILAKFVNDSMECIKYENDYYIRVKE